MYFFSQHGLKNLKVSYVFLVLSSIFACSLRKPPIVSSLADVTNLPTVISLFSAISSCSSKISRICLTRGGALSLIFSLTFSSLGVRNGHLPLSRWPAASHALNSGELLTATSPATPWGVMCPFQFDFHWSNWASILAVQCPLMVWFDLPPDFS